MSLGSGLDAGRSRVRLAEVGVKKGEVALRRYHSVAVEGGESPLAAAASAFGLSRLKVAPLRVGLTGSDVMMKYLPVPQVEDWRLERLMDFEVREIEARSGQAMATSYNLLPVPKELDEDDTILLGLVKEDLLDSWIAALGRLPVQGFSPNSVALYNAYLALGDHAPEATLLANVGAATLDLALVRGTQLYFARSVTTSLEKRDQTLAARLGTDATRAARLVEKHLDLRAGTGARISTDAERVTRPVLPLYDPLPTLLGGVISLCKAQARLRDLRLERVLLTGGGARANGLPELLASRLGIPVELWNPVELLDSGALPESQYEELKADGPAAVVALGLALSAADSDLYALEILPAAARKRRAFRERGVYSVVAGALAVLFLIADFVVTSGRAEELGARSRAIGRDLQAAERNDQRAEILARAIAERSALVRDLSARYAAQRSAQELQAALGAWLPSNLWVDRVTVELADGKAWDQPGVVLPVVEVKGFGVNRERRAEQVLTEFEARIKERLARPEDAVRLSTSNKANEIEWTLQAVLLDRAAGADDAPSTEDEE